MPEVRFGPYTLVKRIAVGGMAEVYLARLGDGEKERYVVVKQILPQLAEEPDLLQLFFDEARIASRVVHPGIVRILDVGEHDGVHFLAMEYVDGLDLSQLMRSTRDAMGERGFPIGCALRIAIDLSRALHHVHEAAEPDGTPLEIVHRDVSPQNVLISKKGEVKLGDFGIARARIRAKRTATGVLRGKIAYVSPEQYLGSRGDRRVDVYAIGVVLFEMLAGRRPYVGDEAIMIREIMTTDAPSIASIVPNIDVRVSSIVALALARKPDERIPNAAALAEALESLNLARPREAVADLAQRALDYRDRAKPSSDPGVPSKPKATQTLPGPPQSNPRTATLKSAPRAVDPRAETNAMPTVRTDPRATKILDLGATMPLPALDEKETIAIPESQISSIASLSNPVLAPRPASSSRYLFLAIIAIGFIGGWILSSIDTTEPVPIQVPVKTTTIARVVMKTATVAEVRTIEPIEISSDDLEEEEPEPEPDRPTKRPKKKKAKRARVDAPISSPVTASPVPTTTEPMREGWGELSLDSEPWSYVHVGRKDLGVTPLANVRLPAGRHRVYLENPERGMSRTINVTIKADEQLAVRVRLEDGRVQRR